MNNATTNYCQIIVLFGLDQIKSPKHKSSMEFQIRLFHKTFVITISWPDCKWLPEEKMTVGLLVSNLDLENETEVRQCPNKAVTSLNWKKHKIVLNNRRMILR